MVESDLERDLAGGVSQQGRFVARWPVSALSSLGLGGRPPAPNSGLGKTSGATWTRPSVSR